MTELDDVKWNFAHHAASSFDRTDAANASPLYAWLARCASLDKEILQLVLHATTKSMRPHMLFAAVQYLLLSGVQDELVEFYPNFTIRPRPHGEAYPYFRAFCLKYAEEICRLVSTYGVQTNNVGRCAILLPAFALVAQHGGYRPLAMLELGPSAGLNMLWDRYGYDYGAAGYVGVHTSPVQIHCEVRGERVPALPKKIPKICWRMGIDLHPLDVHEEEAVRWLRALIWPEHRDRAQLLESALIIARQHPRPMVVGDMVDRLPEVLKQVPVEAILCLYHSYVLYQIPEPIRARILAQIAEFAKTRELFRVSFESAREMGQAALELFWYRGGSEEQRLRLAEGESTGRWMKLSVQ
ncbi:DUF2332 domain-containing protein [Ktedonosporobacter rubrisoli]|uniref:DUF2332 domain-containing protein n=1 Tax=Ktedonosporobacter rubrisoli TaxID=2509675 RepID=UPI0013EE55F6|nr:DUF2332 domain-containing protein [Ktedonosporobacter rubrisoli]